MRAVFRLAARRPAMLGFLREVTRLGPPASTRLLDRLAPLVDRAAGVPRGGDGRRPHAPPRPAPAAAGRLLDGHGMATEVEVLRAFGEEPTLASLVRRRDELLSLLRAALEP